MGRHVYNLPVLLAGTIIISSEEGETEGTHVLVHYDNITTFFFFSPSMLESISFDCDN